MLLQLEGITKSYGSPENRNLRKVLNGVSLEIKEGESIAILGPSGSGKTTLLNIIGSLDQPDSGKVIYKGSEINLFSGSQKDEYRNKQIGFIFQFHYLLPQCTLLENLLIPTLNLKDRNERKYHLEHAIKLMERIGLSDLKDQKPGQLSGGECQRTAVLRAMINSPSILLADEPTGALDSENADRLADLLLELNSSDKVALIVVTHSKSLASKMSRIYELRNGILVDQNDK